MANSLSRREFAKAATGVASAALWMTVPHVFAAENNTIQLALIGCGGRGTGAAANALSVANGPIKLVAMADVFENRLAASYGSLKRQFGEKVDVPDGRRFGDLNGYRKAMDCLKAGDVAIFATPPGFRWVHFAYAIDKGLNVFMEKPLTVDGPTSRKMLKLGELAQQKNLKVGVGLMCRHCKARQALYDRIKGGEIGQIQTLRAYRMAGPTGSAFSGPKPDGISELLYQIRQFHAFLWASGGAVSDFLVHNIDECCWMKDAWPVKVQAIGGRHYRGSYVDQNFDCYQMEYTFADGAKLLLYGRVMDGAYGEFASYAHGTKGAAIISASGHTPAMSRLYRSQSMLKEDLTWAFSDPELNPYQVEWDDLIAAIRDNKPYNEVKRGVEASVVASMGRMAAHTAQVITFDQMLNCEHEFAPDIDNLTLDSPAPLQLGPDGKYPVPQPGVSKRREYWVRE